MPSWNDLLAEFQGVADDQKGTWLQQKQLEALGKISKGRGNRHVVFYYSGFLQKPQAPPSHIQITHEDLNALMSVLHGMDWDRGLTLMLHTPGGVTNAAETLVAYLRSKFPNNFEVIVPALAMSAGTMISLASDNIVMGRQSQLGPIDPQFLTARGALSARAIVDQFERAKAEVLENNQTAHVWAPILQSIGPALLQEAQNALEYGERMVAEWLEQFMFAEDADAAGKAKAAAEHFNDASTHKSHGRRIGRDEARKQGIKVQDLEDDQELQDAVLTAYHIGTITIENSTATKLFLSDGGRLYVKNFGGVPAPPAK